MDAPSDTGRRHLHGDEARCDHNGLLGGGHGLTKQFSILDGAKVVYTLQLRAGHTEPAHAGAGGDEELAISKGPRATCRDQFVLGIKASCARAETNLDVMVPIKGLGLNEQPLKAFVLEQVVLR